MYADYIFAARPLLMLPIWSIYLLSWHYQHRAGDGTFDWTGLVVLAAFTFMAAGSYFLNQIADLQSDFFNNKLGFLQKGIVSARGLTVGFLILSVLSMILSALISIGTLIIAAQIFLLGYCYSASPLRLKDRPVAGFLANAYGYGFLIPVAAIPAANLLRKGFVDWLTPLYFFCTVGSTYLLTTLPDRAGDRLAGKRTSGVVLPRWLVLLLALLLLLASVSVAFFADLKLLMYLSLTAMVPVTLALAIKSDAIILLATKLPILLLTLLAGYFYPWYLLFLVAVVVFTRAYYRHRFGITYPRLI